MAVIASFQIFGQVYVMTGGPYKQYRTIVQYLYEQGFRYFKMGYASAIAYTLFAIMMVFYPDSVGSSGDRLTGGDICWVWEQSLTHDDRGFGG